MMEISRRRLHIGGLFPGVQESELREKFEKFGKITGVDIKIKKDEASKKIRMPHLCQHDIC